LQPHACFRSKIFTVWPATHERTRVLVAGSVPLLSLIRLTSSAVQLIFGAPGFISVESTRSRKANGCALRLVNVFSGRAHQRPIHVEI